MSGSSMLPTLAAGDRLLVLRTKRLRPGDLVEIADPTSPGRTLVKRVAEVRAGSVVVIGDNPAASTDSRHFGPLPMDCVRGRPFYRYHPSSSPRRFPGRTGGPGGA